MWRKTLGKPYEKHRKCSNDQAENMDFLDFQKNLPKSLFWEAPLGNFQRLERVGGQGGQGSSGGWAARAAQTMCSHVHVGACANSITSVAPPSPTNSSGGIANNGRLRL